MTKHAGTAETTLATLSIEVHAASRTDVIHVVQLLESVLVSRGMTKTPCGCRNSAGDVEHGSNCVVKNLL
jgi:hypothetical protein